jgi:peptidyl-tRNA hydrolase
MQAGQPSILTPADAKGMRKARRKATVEIHDAGHTEIAPGSMTALAR